MKYFLVFKMDPVTTTIFHSVANKEEFEILGERQNVFLVSQKDEKGKLTDKEISYILGMARFQNIKGIVDISHEVDFLRNYKGTEQEKMHQFSWMMRNRFTRALVNKMTGSES